MSSNQWDNVLKAFDKKVSGLQNAVKLSSSYSVNITKSYAPVKTGKLQSEIESEVNADGFGFVLRSPTEYAPFVNYGTARQKPNPYFDRGVLATQTFFIDQIKQALKK